MQVLHDVKIDRVTPGPLGIFQHDLPIQRKAVGRTMVGIGCPRQKHMRGFRDHRKPAIHKRTLEIVSIVVGANHPAMRRLTGKLRDIL